MTTRYFVVFPNGQRFGPADEMTLQLWVAENRVGPGTMLMEESTGRTLLASQIPSLGLAQQQPSAAYSPYYRNIPVGAPATQSSTETVLAWILGAIGLVTCFATCGVFSIVGIILAAVGLSKKQRGAGAALAFNIVVTVLTFLLPILGGLAFSGF